MSVVDLIERQRTEKREAKFARYVALVKRADTLTAAEIAELDQLLSELGIALATCRRAVNDLREYRQLSNALASADTKGHLEAARDTLEVKRSLYQSREREKIAKAQKSLPPGQQWRMEDAEATAKSVGAEMGDDVRRAHEAYQKAEAAFKAEAADRERLRRLGKDLQKFL